MTTVRSDRLTRLTRLTRALTGLTFTLSVLAMSHLYAATASAAPLIDLDDKINTLTTKLTGYGRVLTTLAVIIVFLSWICEPALPSWARENKGLFARVLVGAIGLGLAPDIASFVFG